MTSPTLNPIFYKLFGLESCCIHSNVLTLSSPFLSRVIDSFWVYKIYLRNAKVREHYIFSMQGWCKRKKKKYCLWSWEVKRKKMIWCCLWVVSLKMTQLCHPSVHFSCICWLFINDSKTGRTEGMSVHILQTVRFHAIMCGVFC